MSVLMTRTHQLVQRWFQVFPPSDVRCCIWMWGCTIEVTWNSQMENGWFSGRGTDWNTMFSWYVSGWVWPWLWSVWLCKHIPAVKAKEPSDIWYLPTTPLDTFWLLTDRQISEKCHRQLKGSTLKEEIKLDQLYSSWENRSKQSAVLWLAEPGHLTSSGRLWVRQFSRECLRLDPASAPHMQISMCNISVSKDQLVVSDQWEAETAQEHDAARDRSRRWQFSRKVGVKATDTQQNHHLGWYCPVGF